MRCPATFAGERCDRTHSHPGPHWARTAAGTAVWTDGSLAEFPDVDEPVRMTETQEAPHG